MSKYLPLIDLEDRFIELIIATTEGVAKVNGRVEVDIPNKLLRICYSTFKTDTAVKKTKDPDSFVLSPR